MKNIWHVLQANLLDMLAYKASRWDIVQKRKFAYLLGYVVFNVLRIRRDYVISAMAKHLKLSYSKAKDLAWKSYKTFFENAIEQASTAYLDGNTIDSRIEVTGESYLSEAYNLKKGLIIISAHIGLWEIMPGWLARNGYDITVVVRRQSNQAVDRWFENMRNRFGVKTTDSSYKLREHIMALKNGGLLGLMCDQDAGKKGVFVDFLGEKASTVVGPAALSIKYQVPIIAMYMLPTYCSLSNDYGVKYKLIIEKPIIPNSYSNNLESIKNLTQEYTRLVEKWVLRYPEQWFWLHRRWKTKINIP